METANFMIDRFHNTVTAIYDWAKVGGGNRTHGYSNYHIVTMMMREGLTVDANDFDELMEAIDVVRQAGARL